MKQIGILACSWLAAFVLAACGVSGGKESESMASKTNSAVQSLEETSRQQERVTSEAETTSETVSATASKDTSASEESLAPPVTNIETNSEEEKTIQMDVTIGDAIFSASLEENTAVDAFVALMKEEPVVIQMRDYSGFEKVGPLGTSLPESNHQTTTQSGDIVLYNGNQIVIFYGSNSWSYTRIGRIENLTGWEEALGSGDVTVTFSVGE